MEENDLLVIFQIAILYVISGLHPQLSTPLFFILFAYASIGIIRPRNVKARIFLVFLVSALVIFGGVMQYTQARSESLSQHNTSDTLIAMESGAEVLLQGKNPYFENFFETDLGKLNSRETEKNYWKGLGLDNNPAIFHFAYPPGAFLFPAGIFWLVGKIDLRWVFGLIVIIALGSLFLIFKKQEWAITSALAFIPIMYMGGIHIGVMDIPILGLCIIALAAMHQNRHIFAALSWGAILTLKQLTWPLFIFVLIWAWKNKKLNTYALAPLLAAIISAPFILWNIPAYIDDNWLYLFGQTEYAYPLNPLVGGIPLLLYSLGLSVKQIATIPIILLQFFTTLPIFALFVRAFLHKQSLSHIFIYAGATIFIATIFYKNFFFNYLNFGFSLFILGALLHASEGNNITSLNPLKNSNAHEE